MILPSRVRKYLPAILAFAVIAALTLRSIPTQARLSALTPVFCLVCGTIGLVDVLLNVLLFVPLGMALHHAGLRLIRIAGIGLGLSLIIELVQFGFLPGRDASLSDLITNTAGAVLGGILGATWRKLVFPRPSRALRMATVYAIAWASIWGASAALLHPDPRPGEYYGQWAHDFDDNRTQWRGQVTEVRLNGIPVPDGLVPDEPLRDALEGGEFTLELHGVSGPPPHKVAQIFGLASSRSEIFVEWTQYGRDLRFMIRYGPSLLRLRSPIVRLDYAAPADSGEVIHLIARERGGVLSAEVRTPRDTIVASHALTPSLSWTFALPFTYRWGFETRWATVLWVLSTLIPLGYWGARAGGPRTAALAVGGAALSGLALAPLIGGLPPVHWSEWFGAVLAWGAGVMLARVAPPEAEVVPQVLVPRTRVRTRASR